MEFRDLLAADTATGGRWTRRTSPGGAPVGPGPTWDPVDSGRGRERHSAGGAAITPVANQNRTWRSRWRRPAGHDADEDAGGVDAVDMVTGADVRADEAATDPTATTGAAYPWGSPPILGHWDRSYPHHQR